jgi:hypothetical protein
LLSIAGLLGVAVVSAGCAGSSSSSPGTQAPLPPQAAPMQIWQNVIEPDVCGGKGTKENLSSSGGTLTLPACGGYTGNITYGSNNAPSGTTVTLISTTKNPGGVPVPSKGTVLAFVQATGHSNAGSVTFGSTSSKSTITNKKKLKSTHTYSLYAYALGLLITGFPQSIGSASNGVLTFTSPLNGQDVPQGITIDFELVQN